GRKETRSSSSSPTKGGASTPAIWSPTKPSPGASACSACGNGSGCSGDACWCAPSPVAARGSTSTRRYTDRRAAEGLNPRHPEQGTGTNPTSHGPDALATRDAALGALTGSELTA